MSGTNGEQESLEQKVTRLEANVASAIVEALTEVFNPTRPLLERAERVSAFARGEIEMLVTREGVHVRVPGDAPQPN